MWFYKKKKKKPHHWLRRYNTISVDYEKRARNNNKLIMITGIL